MKTDNSDPESVRNANLQAAARAYLERVEKEIEENPDTDFASHIRMNQQLHRIADIIAAKHPPLSHGEEDDEVSSE